MYWLHSFSLQSQASLSHPYLTATVGGFIFISTVSEALKSLGLDLNSRIRHL